LYREQKNDASLPAKQFDLRSIFLKKSTLN
jgi:hypothetical protein